MHLGANQETRRVKCLAQPPTVEKCHRRAQKAQAAYDDLAATLVDYENNESGTYKDLVGDSFVIPQTKA